MIASISVLAGARNLYSYNITVLLAPNLTDCHDARWPAAKKKVIDARRCLQVAIIALSHANVLAASRSVGWTAMATLFDGEESRCLISQQSLIRLSPIIKKSSNQTNVGNIGNSY